VVVSAANPKQKAPTRWQQREIERIAAEFGKYHERRDGETPREFLVRMLRLHREPCHGFRGGCE
jgi:hypothetical protein